jgi:hypothetical protein
VREGERIRIISLASLAAALSCSPEKLQAILLVLFRCVPEEVVEGVDKFVEESALGVRGNVRSVSVRSETSLYKNIYESERIVAFGDNSKEHGSTDFAMILAVALDDIGSLGGFRKLLREYPLPLLQEALRRTNRIPPEKIAKSRGALFTGIVRKLAAAGSTLSSADAPPYA